MLNMILEYYILIHINIHRINALIIIISFLKYLLLPNVFQMNVFALRNLNTSYNVYASMS